MSEIVYDGQDIRISISPARNADDPTKGIVTFSTRSLKNIGPIFERDNLQDLRLPAVHVQSKWNHWWHTEEIKNIEPAIRKLGLREYHLYGSSMGAYACLMLPKFLKAKGSIALSPQTYVLSKNGLADRRWDADRPKIKCFFDEEAWLLAQRDTPLWIFMDCANPMERPHAEALKAAAVACNASRWTLIDVPYSHHPVTPVLKRAQILGRMLKGIVGQQKLDLDSIRADSLHAYETDPKSFMNFLRSAPQNTNLEQYAKRALDAYKSHPAADSEFQIFAADYFMRIGAKERALEASSAALANSSGRPYMLEKHAVVLEAALGPIAAADFLDDRLKSVPDERLRARAAALRERGEQFAGEKEKVLVGRDNFLFLRNDTNNTIAQITGQYSLSPTFAQKWADLFQYRRMMLARARASYIFAAAPSKECVYHDKLPPGTVFSENRPIKKVLSAAEGVARHFYPLELLRKMRQQGQEPYPKGDTHWDFVGALVSYRGLMEFAGLHAVDPAQCKLTTIDYECDLSTKLGYNSAFTKGTIVGAQASRVFDNKIRNIGGKIIYEHPNKKLPRCVLFRDSFSILQLPLFAESFSRLVAVWQPNIDYTIVAAEAPDIVITQHAERFLVSVPDDFSGMTNEDHVRRKTA